MEKKSKEQPNKAEGAPTTCSEERINCETLTGRLQAISEFTIDCCWMRREYPDGRSHREWITGSPERLTGYSTEEFSQIGLEKLVHPDDLPFALTRVKGPEGTSEHEFRIITKAGEIRWLGERMRSHQHEDGVLVVFGSTHDITVQKTAEGAFQESRRQQSQSQKMEALGMLAGGVAHDFNNLLTVIMGYGELALGDEELTPNLARYVKEIDLAAERAAGLTQQLLAFSRRHPMVGQVISLNDLISETMKMLQRLVPTSIDLVTGLAPTVPDVDLDVGQFEQVIVNLVVNARDALDESGCIEITTKRVRVTKEHDSEYVEDPEGKHALFQVTDDGCGIAPVDMQRIFEPFYTTKAAGQGTGLGLAAVYGTVAQSGGWVHVESKVGEGTTFSVFLPAVFAKPKRSKDLPVESGQSTGSETVLLVEDEHRVRILLRKALSQLGYRIMDTGRPADALTMSEEFEGKIHLLLTDMVMPEMGGRELAERIQKGRPEIQILFMSGYPANEQGDAEPLNEDNFVAKPMTPNELGRRVRRVLDLRPAGG
jgi:PAS domain S-box-containing protein